MAFLRLIMTKRHNFRPSKDPLGCVILFYWYILGVKRSSSHTQIGLVWEFINNFRWSSLTFSYGILPPPPPPLPQSTREQICNWRQTQTCGQASHSMELFHDVTLFQFFPRQIIELASPLQSFIRISCKLMRILDPKLKNFTKSFMTVSNAYPRHT